MTEQAPTDHRKFVSYIDKSREFYLAQDYGNPYRWGGQYWDGDLGLYYTGSNWYSPDLGRATTGGFVPGLALGNTAGEVPDQAKPVRIG